MKPDTIEDLKEEISRKEEQLIVLRDQLELKHITIKLLLALEVIDEERLEAVTKLAGGV